MLLRRRENGFITLAITTFLLLTYYLNAAANCALTLVCVTAVHTLSEVFCVIAHACLCVAVCFCLWVCAFLMQHNGPGVLAYESNTQWSVVICYEFFYV